VWVSAVISLVGLNVLSERGRADDDLGEVVHDVSGVPSGKRASRDKTPPPPEVEVEVDLAEVEVEVFEVEVEADAFVEVFEEASVLVDASVLDASVLVGAADCTALEVELDGGLQVCRLAIRLIGFVERSTATSTDFDRATSTGFDRATALLCARRDHWLPCEKSAAPRVAKRATVKMQSCEVYIAKVDGGGKRKG